jgi:hypothetical protein
MSIGNLKDYGNKGNNFPFQLKVLEGIQAVFNALTGVTLGQQRKAFYISDTGAGSIPVDVYSFSIANVGAASGTVSGQVLPAGATINFDAGVLNHTFISTSYDATGTTFLITYVK